VKPSPSFLNLTKSQRRGILWTLAIFLVLHLALWFYPKNNPKEPSLFILDSLAQQKVDSLIAVKPTETKDTIYPFNPNYISDFKAYQLGISMEVVQRIRSFRDSGKYINSLQDFKNVTQLPDDKLTQIHPYLKLPKQRFSAPEPTKVVRITKELNGASETDLQEVYGIGEVYAKRIIDLRNKIGGFLVKDQLNDVWGLTPETQSRIWEHFTLDSIPTIKKKDINEITIAELSALHYISPSLASQIVVVRTQKDTLASWEDLSGIQQLDSIKKARLSLYLSFNSL
jgi:DNA uptake protein ComE-like DNA-binding protein